MLGGARTIAASPVGFFRSVVAHEGAEDLSSAHCQPEAFAQAADRVCVIASKKPQRRGRHPVLGKERFEISQKLLG